MSGRQYEATLRSVADHQWRQQETSSASSFHGLLSSVRSELINVISDSQERRVTAEFHCQLELRSSTLTVTVVSSLDESPSRLWIIQVQTNNLKGRDLSRMQR